MSGDVSDACYYCLCEKDFSVNQEFMDNYEIHFYARYRDDCIIICNPEFFED